MSTPKWKFSKWIKKNKTKKKNISSHVVKSFSSTFDDKFLSSVPDVYRLCMKVAVNTNSRTQYLLFAE